MNGRPVCPWGSWALLLAHPHSSCVSIHCQLEVERVGESHACARVPVWAPVTWSKDTGRVTVQVCVLARSLTSLTLGLSFPVCVEDTEGCKD